MTLEKFALGAEIDAGGGVDAVLSIKNEIRLRPSVFDPDLKTVLELSFNLVNFKLTGACSMTDERHNPLGIYHDVGTKKMDILVGNTAVALGWIEV